MIYLPKHQGEPSFVIAEWTAEPTTNGKPELQAPLHLHHECDEAWYILEGTLSFTLGDKTVTAGKGQCVFVPHGTAHTYWNPNPETAKYLLVMTPLTHRLVEKLHALPEETPEALARLYKAHNAEYLGQPKPAT